MVKNVFLSERSYAKLREVKANSAEDETEPAAQDGAGGLVARDKVGEAYFGRFAGREPTERLRNRIFWMARHLHGERILDVGTSEGILPVLAAREGFEATGLDVNEEAIAYARMLASNETKEVQSRIDFRVADFVTFAQNCEPFDTVSAGEIIEHQVAQRQFFKTCHDILAKDGRLIVTTPFGVSPDPDHKVSLYPSDIADFAEGLFALDIFEAADGYLRFVATKQTGAARVSEERVRLVAEEGAFESQRRLFGQVDALQGQAATARADAIRFRKRGEQAQSAAKDAAKAKQDLQSRIAEAETAASESEAALSAAKTDLASLTESNTATQEQLSRAQSDVERLEEALAAVKKASQKAIKTAEADAAKAAASAAAYAERTKRLEAVLKDVRAAALASNKRLKEYKNKASALQGFAGEIRGSTSYRLGNALVLAVRRPHRIIAKVARRLAGKRRPAAGLPALPAPPKSISVPLVSSIPLAKDAKYKPQIADAAEPIGLTKMKRTASFDVADLRMALIGDEFTRLNLGSTCTVAHVTPDGWRTQLQGVPLDILFIESAWRGLDNTWHRKLQKVPPQLKALLRAARHAGIPIVFWNKEDPVHFSAWLNVARQADHVFTTDIECVPGYIDALGHTAVSVLPFACSPKLTNPIADLPRTAGASFAGSYYHRYPQRAADLDMLADLARGRGELSIYDRNWQSGYADFAYPERFAPYLKPSLPFERISEAYKGYEIGINMNSVRQSPTMFARRIFELMASNTLVLSNYSFGARLMLGELIVSGENKSTIEERLSALDRSGDATGLKLQALRKVLSGHTYYHRLARVAQTVGVPAVVPPLHVCCVARIASRDDALRVAASFDRQRHRERTLFLVLTDEVTPEDADLIAADTDAVIVVGAAGHGVWRDAVAQRAHGGAEGEHVAVAVLSADHTYGAHYLTDMVNARHFFEGDGVTRDPAGPSYVPVTKAFPSRSLLRADIATRLGIDAIVADEPVEGGFLTLDAFNLAVNDTGVDPDALDPQPVTDQGIEIEAIDRATERLRAQGTAETDVRLVIDGSALAAGMGQATRDAVTWTADPQGIAVTSTLASDAHAYAFMKRKHGLAELTDSGQRSMMVRVESSGTLTPQAVLIFHDEKGERVGQALPKPGGTRRVAIPVGAAEAKIGLRFAGTGKTTVSSITFGGDPSSKLAWIPRASTLVVAHGYPSEDDIYRHAFVHRRVKTYWDEGMPCDVLRFSATGEPGRHEFEGVDVTTGHVAELEAALASGAYDNVLVHFLSRECWEVLKPYLGRIDVTVWLHGSEVQPWHRREFNITDDAARTRAMRLSAVRESLWQDVFATSHPSLHFVFVADYARREIEEDYGVSFPTGRFDIVHNFIDTDLFDYQAKQAEQRFNVLSIRPFASRKYANDISVEAIRLLSERPDFDRYRFCIYGDGDLFDETLAPIRHLENVVIERSFLTQPAIAATHKDFGVWLSPTRMDWQGVSRDEAMSSGLVPITTDNTAIPEFVDASCGFLCAEEDPVAVADAIQALADDADLFQRLSAAAAKRVRGQSGLRQTIMKEIDIVTGRSRQALARR